MALLTHLMKQHGTCAFSAILHLVITVDVSGMAIAPNRAFSSTSAAAASTGAPRMRGAGAAVHALGRLAAALDAEEENASVPGIALVELQAKMQAGKKAGRRKIAPVDLKAAAFPPAFTVSETRCPTGYAEIGCVVDVQEAQRRWYHEWVDAVDQVPMTPEVCFKFCQNVTGVQYFGLKRGTQCYCSPYYKTGEGASGSCNTPCEGDASATCGGIERVDLYSMHDCNNMPAINCKRPPTPVKNAKLYASRFYRKTKVPCRNAMDGPLDTHKSHCAVDCNEGYELVSNNIQCVEKGDLSYSWAQLQGKAICSPVKCGSPPDMPHARYPRSNVVFPNEVVYTCQLGYTLDAQARGNKTHTISCQATRLFSATKECKPVNCGMCPSVDFSSIQEGKNERVFEDMCNYDCLEGYTLDQQATGVASFKTRCLAGGNFSEAQACLPVACGPAPKLKNAKVKEHKGVSANDTLVYKEQASYTCDVGHSLTGLFGGEVAFSITCTAEGFFTAPPAECKPVKCGAPALVKNALYAATPLVYAETVTYTCDLGYTLTGKADAKSHLTIACGADGQFEQNAPSCLPVECGKAPTHAHASLQGNVASLLTFESPALEYTCAPGYSADVEDDPRKPKATEYVIACGADGNFSVAPACVNIDDCRIHSCGRYGVCVDHEEPTGDAFEDYSCKCEAGYETIVENRTGESEKICTNIDDCPIKHTCGGKNDHGILRGVCEDQLMAYTCNCGSGYELTYLEVTNQKAGGAIIEELLVETKEDAQANNATCTALVCGPVPSVALASAVGQQVGAEATYDTEPWSYSCNEGHSLDGLASGPKEFEARCTSAGVISSLQACTPVTCGSLKAVSNADVSPKLDEMLFPAEVEYTCDVGYTLTGKAGGTSMFKVSCQATGEQTNLSECKPVECGKIPVHSNASYDKDRLFVFPQTTVIECLPGYSLDQTANPESSSYSLNCQSDGQWSMKQACKPVSCGECPEVANTIVEAGEKVYTEKATYSLKKGYTLDAKVEGPTSFQVECQASSRFTATKVALPVSCGLAPLRKHASNSGTSHVYGEQALYVCDEGYSLDAKADGLKQFALNCTSSGGYEGPDGCLPVECGRVSPLVNAVQVEGNDSKMLTFLVYGQHAQFKCKPGYSKTGQLQSENVYSRVTCSSDGELIYPTQDCINNDDCAGPFNQCVPNGQCKDNRVPTGKHSDDFQCVCDSGFAENKTIAGPRKCYNVPDCPQGACLPGTCHDRINDYECSCPAGYFGSAEPRVSTNRNRGLIMEIALSERDSVAHHCLPVECGTAPEQPHAQLKNSTVGETIYFDSDPLEYTCVGGYSLDGTAVGETNFNLACLSNKSFQKAPPCLPVVCGEPPIVVNSGSPRDQVTTTTGVLVYPQEKAYECNEGYSIDGSYSADNTKFNTICQANGTFSQVPACQAIRCPLLPSQEYTTVDHGGTSLVYPQRIAQSCSDGYALQQHQHDLKTYSIACTAKGELEYTPKNTSSGNPRCAPISCGDFPTIPSSTVDGGQLFGESATVTCAEGYSTDQSTLLASATQQIFCKSDGDYSQALPCKPVLCGVPPVVRNTTRSIDAERVFQDEVTYSLQAGYTLSGDHDGAKEFKIQCQASGSFTATSIPQAVRCGPSPQRPHATHSGLNRVFPFLL